MESYSNFWLGTYKYYTILKSTYKMESKSWITFSIIRFQNFIKHGNDSPKIKIDPLRGVTVVVLGVIFSSKR